MDDVRTALFALAIWGPVIASLALFAVRASKGISALRTMPTRATVSAGVMLVLLLTALCYTWGYMLLMVADDMVLTGDTSIVTWFMRSGNWHRPHSMIFEAYQLTSLDPVQWWITGQVRLFSAPRDSPKSPFVLAPSDLATLSPGANTLFLPSF
jgi:hypothetical protein